MQNDVASVLIDAGIQVNEGVLHAAARGDSPGIVRKLVSLGADAKAVFDGMTPLQEWWERSQQVDVGLGGDYVLLELIHAGASACWLFDHLSELNVVAQSFLRSGAPDCAID
jgi:hypothetical protein